MDFPGPQVSDFIGRLPYRLALAGGWIDQPFVSRLNPNPTGAMVVVSLEPTFRFMDRCGMGTSTRRVAAQLWGDCIPDRDPHELMRELYEAENHGKSEPSGSQDMAGLIFPGISRLNYAYDYADGAFPAHIESNNDPAVIHWLENNLYMLPVIQRPPGYNPLEVRSLDPHWIHRLGQSGKDCYDAITRMDLAGLGASMNECMACWEAILPGTVHHATIPLDLPGLLRVYQARYPGAMYSGCGGGYLIVASGETVPGSFQVKIRAEKQSKEAAG